VLLQKTLLNIEGLGRQLDPDLDLWDTAKPFLERWMNEQIGWRGLRDRLVRESSQWSELLPQLPRLAHRALLRLSGPDESIGIERELARLAREHRRLRWALLAVGLLATGSLLLLARQLL
jgi:ubiquinone biosynthesis protein